MMNSNLESIIPFVLWALAGSIITLYMYYKLGHRFKIYDVPNERSSHQNITIRGGGVVLLILNGMWLFFEPNEANILLSLSISIGVLIGFLDDILTLKTWTRFLVYLLAVCIVLFGVLKLQRFDTFIWIPLIIIILGAVNTYNFMDGINGITALYSIIILGSSYLILNELNIDSWNTCLLLYSCFFVAFSLFNLRLRALMFLGDSGSVAMGLLTAFLVVRIGIQIESWSSIVLLAVYGVDSVGSIIIRLIKKENILTAHRSHLYQDLVHITKWRHISVSLLYALIQLFINIGFFYVLSSKSIEWYAVSILLVLALLFYFIKRSLHGKHLFNV